MNAGPTGPVKSWLDRLLEIVMLLVVIALLLNWAVNLIRPILPFIVITVTIFLTICTVVTILVRRHQNGW